MNEMLTLLRLGEPCELRIVATMSRLRLLAQRGWTPEYAITVVSTIRDGMVTEEDRDFVWRAFGVPVYDRLVDENGIVLAQECDAHDGLHLERPLPARYRGQIISVRCGCGQDGPRILAVSRDSPL